MSEQTSKDCANPVTAEKPEEPEASEDLAGHRAALKNFCNMTGVKVRNAGGDASFSVREPLTDVQRDDLRRLYGKAYPDAV